MDNRVNYFRVVGQLSKARRGFFHHFHCAIQLVTTWHFDTCHRLSGKDNNIICYFIYLYSEKGCILDSERSDECIDFTMLCVFCVCVSVYTRTCRNNSSISNFRGGFRWKSESCWCIIGEFLNAPGKTGIFTQNQFSTKSIFLYGCNSKTILKYLKFTIFLKIFLLKLILWYIQAIKT
ncbi:Uncharacterized protein FWK35_00030372 [Aphis craccivora]|uniref:Uncharacterized protein n=1 Tax=Aphis craccivora TaxID=307492 RepID=A0A6G0YPR9_APHCR|nr:Uncharacterized protein FWK35_00030372 [Aphis craccivora]